MSAESVELWLMRILFGLATCVSTMKGSKVVVGTDPPSLCTVAIVLDGLLVPHQLFVAVTGLSSFQRFEPRRLELLPASRLKLIVSEPDPGLSLPIAIPPPFPVELLPVMVTLDSVTGWGSAVWIVLI